MENTEMLELNYPYLSTMDYTTQQMILPLDLGKKINSSDPVFSFLKVMEGVNWNQYLSRPVHRGRESYNPFKMIKTILFAYMNNIYSLRKIEDACKTDIRFMYLMEEEQPSHSAIHRFIETYIKGSIENIYKDIFESICLNDNVDTNILCIDGTKIEANANKFTFIWKKTAITTRDKTFEKLNKLVKKIQLYTDIHEKSEWTVQDIMDILERLIYISEKEGITFVYGKGKRKSDIQKVYDELIRYQSTLESCFERIEICGPKRNSSSKTDHDATMMHMKEDHYMKTGIFKAGYNVQIGVCDEYIAYTAVYQDRSDQPTLMSFLERYRNLYGRNPKVVVADAGYGSYDNYMYCLERSIEAYIKYTMYRNEKAMKYKLNRFLKTNWERDEYNRYICPAGHVFEYTNESVDKRSKYYRINQQHRCENCVTCEMRNECTKAKEGRVLTVNPILDELQAAAKERLDSEAGIRLRMKRSIETEGAFGVIKANWDYDHFHRRSIKKVEMEFQMVCIGYNLMKYHRKVNRGKLMN